MLIDGLITVVKNPLAPVEHIGGAGVNYEMFELGLEQFVVCCAPACMVKATHTQTLGYIQGATLQG